MQHFRCSEPDIAEQLGTLAKRPDDLRMLEVLDLDDTLIGVLAEENAVQVQIP